MKITFKLGARDVRHLKRLLSRAAAAAELSTEDIVRAALEMVEAARSVRPPDYVLARLETLEDIAALLEDEDWRLPESVRKQVCNALGYFVNPSDLIPDNVPGLGFLDDAIMIELVARDFKDEIKGYQSFRRHRARLERRKAEPGRTRRLLEQKRREIRRKIQDRRGKSQQVSSSS